MVITKAAVIGILGLIMVPHWDIANVMLPSDMGYVIKHFIIMLPFIAMSIEFFPGLGPVVIYFRKTRIIRPFPIIGPYAYIG